MNRDLLTIYDLTPGEIEVILNKAKELKEMHLQGELYHPLEGKTLAMIFEKPSTRTRVSFEVGMHQFDRSLAMIHMADAQKLFNLDSRVNGVRLKLDDMFTARHVTHDLEQLVGVDYWVKDWTHMHSNLFKALQTSAAFL